MKRWLALSGLLLLAGCAAGPSYRAPDEAALAPARFSTSDAALGAGAPVDRWWTALADPTLDALIDKALADNPDLAAAEARVRQARAVAQVTGAEFYPSLNADARFSRDRLSRHGENLALIPFNPSTTEFTDYRIGFDASWEIDLAGKTRRDVEAAVARLGSAAASRDQAGLVVAADVAGAYVDYRASAARATLAEKTLASFDATLKLVRLEEQAGVSSEIDRRRTESERLDANAALAPLAAAREAALFQLAALTGEPIETLRRELAAEKPVPKVPPSAPVGLPAELLRRRPDIRSAERELAAATADVGSAVAAQFPRITLTGDFGWESVHSGDLIGSASRYWNLTPQITVPLFAGGRLRGQVKASEGARDAMLASYRGTVLRALADTESAIVRFASERGRESTLAAAESTLRRNLELVQRREAAGDTSRLEVLEAERALDQATDARTASQAQLAQDYVALGKALGGGWAGQAAVGAAK